MKPGKTGLRRIYDAAGYSIKGLCFAWRNESAFRQELVLTLIMLPAGLYLGETATEKALLVGCLFVVLITEVLNSSIEAAIDRIGDDYHKLSGSAKDLGSAAVFLSLVMTVVIWALILIERYFPQAAT